MEDQSSLHGILLRARDRWTELERGWQAVLVAYLVVALVVLAP